MKSIERQKMRMQNGMRPRNVVWGEDLGWAAYRTWVRGAGRRDVENLEQWIGKLILR